MLFQTVISGPTLGQGYPSTAPSTALFPTTPSGSGSVADFLTVNPVAKAVYDRWTSAVAGSMLKAAAAMTIQPLTSIKGVGIYAAHGYKVVRDKLTAQTQYVSPEALQTYMVAMVKYSQAFDAGTLVEGKALLQQADSANTKAQQLEAAATGAPAPVQPPTTPVTPPAAAPPSTTANLVQGVDYTCTSTSCSSGKPAVAAAFMALQAAINRAAAVSGIAQIGTPDGKIGARTVTAVAALRSKFGSGDLETVAAPTPTMVAARAVWLAKNLNAFADGVKAPVAPPSPAVPPPAVAVTPTTPTTKPGAAPPSAGPAPGAEPAPYTPPAEGSNTIWWVVGGIAALAVVGVVGYTIYKRKKTPDHYAELPAAEPTSEPVPAMSGYRRRHARPRFHY